MTEESHTHGKVTIRYDTEKGLDRTVRHEDITINGKPISGVLLDLMSPDGRNIDLSRLDSAKPQLALVQHDLYDAVWSLPEKTRYSMVFRDATDRIQEVFLNSICVRCFQVELNQQALQFCLWASNMILEWEGKQPGSVRYLHKGNPYFFGAIAALRVGDLDLGFLLLEAAEDTDRRTYELAGRPREWVNRPGTFTLLLRENSNNMLYLDVQRLRHRVEQMTAEFLREGGLPSGATFSIQDMDGLFLGAGDWRAAAKLWGYYMVWTLHTIENPALASVTHRGDISLRRRAEVLLGILTATEQIVRKAEGVSPPTTHYVDVLDSLVGNQRGAQPTLRSIRGQLSDRDGEADLDRFLTYWSRGQGAHVGGFPWYVRWIEPARVLRNKIAHLLEAPTPLQKNWEETERLARFALFSALCILREKQTRPPSPSPPVLEVDFEIQGAYSSASASPGTISPTTQHLLPPYTE